MAVDDEQRKLREAINPPISDDEAIRRMTEAAKKATTEPPKKKSWLQRLLGR